MNHEEALNMFHSMDLKIKAMVETLDNKITLLSMRIDKLQSEAKKDEPVQNIPP